MRVPVTLVIAALPFVLSVPAPPGENNARSVGFAVPISRHNEVRGQDGVVSLQSLKADTQQSISGILRGFLRYQINTGAPHPLASGLGQSLSSLKRETGSVPLVDATSNLWYGNIEVGTPAVTFTVDFDTGSSDLFLPSTGCNSNCEGHTRYNPSASGTAVDLNKTFELEYADGTSVSGEQYNDTVSIAGLTADSQTLGAASTYSTGFAASNFPPDGLLGLGYQQISAYDSPPLFKTLIAQGRVTLPQFAVKLASTGSELYLGGTNSQLYEGSFTYIPVTTQGYWRTVLTDVTVNNDPILLSERSVVIDTGTTLIVGDKNDVEKIYSQILGAQSASSTVGEGYFTFPCDSDTNISLMFGPKRFPVSSSTFNLGPASAGSSDCIGGLIYSSDVDLWIIGELFLRNVYTVFDMGENVIGFADLTSAPS